MKDHIHGFRRRRTHGGIAADAPSDPQLNARFARGAVDEPIIGCLFRGYARCAEAEARLSGCASDDERLVLEAQLNHVKRELQQLLDDYVDARIQRWLAGHPEAERPP